MSELQRYDDPHHNMEPCADGAWVMADEAAKRIAALEAENRALCVHGAEPTDEEWIALRGLVDELKAEVERLRGDMEQIKNNTRPNAPWALDARVLREVHWCASKALAEGGA